MKRGCVFLVLWLAIPLWALAERVPLTPGSEDVTVTVLASGPDETVLRFDVAAFDRQSVDIGGESYYLLRCGKESLLHHPGEPALPHLCRSVVIPDDAEMAVTILDSAYQDFPLSPVAPSKGNLLRTLNPDSVPYSFSDVYQSDSWYPASLASLREPFILRDVRGTVVEVNSFQVQPQANTLRVYTSVTVSIRVTGPGVTNVLSRFGQPEKVDPEFHQVYQRQFLNYGLSAERYVPVMENGGMLIITCDSFRVAMRPFLQWKIQKGIPTRMVNVSTIGNTATAVRDYIQAYYDSATAGLAYVLLVGDAAQIATPTSDGGSADPTYAKVAGTDSYPDIFIGRFSAESVAQVQTQVKRSIEYERDALSTATWYPHGTCIGSEYGPGQDGNEYDWQHELNIRADLLNMTYTSVDTIFGMLAGGATVSSDLNLGRSIVNYTGHGSATSWGTTGFSNTNVANLRNDNMLPFIFSVACLNGQFDGITCFAEAWLRSTHNGQPIGAVAAYMSSINQSWDPPMDAQDEASDILLARSKTTFGGMCFNAACKMMDLNADTMGSNMFDTWHIFGDPSLQLRTANPAAVVVTHDTLISSNQEQFAVTVAGVTDALCCLSRDTILYGAAQTDADGAALIPVTGSLLVGDTLKVTVTAFNRQTYVARVRVVAAGTDLWPPNIFFTPLDNTGDPVGPYALSAVISDLSGIADATFYYGFDSLTYTSLPMTHGAGDTWTVSFGGFVPGVKVYYYLSAADASPNANSTTTAINSFSVLGVLFSDSMESGAGAWTDSVLQTGWTNQWHIEGQRTRSGTHSWKFGGTGVGADTLYAGHSYGGLISPSIVLSGPATLSFWQFMRAETSAVSFDSAYDGGAVDVAVDSGAWQQLITPSPWYNKRSRCSNYSGPFSCATRIYSGAINWSPVSISLDAYAGHSVRLRFRFGSDAAGNKEGWYIDDVSVFGMLPSGPPSPVSNLTILAINDSIRLAWSPTGAPRYNIYGSPDTRFLVESLDSTVSDTMVTLPLTASKRFFLVRASNSY
jgi:hypothetical protein